MTTGGAKLDSPTPSGEIFSSTLGLLVPGTTGLEIVVSGHAVGDAGSPIVLADGTEIGNVTHNVFLRGAAGSAPLSQPSDPADETSPGAGGDGGALPPPFEPAGPDVAVGRWNHSVLGLPLTVSLSIGATSVPVPVTGAVVPTVAMPIKISCAGGLLIGVITRIDATVTDARTQSKINSVAVARYASGPTDSGAPITTLNPETGLPVIVGFHGGQVADDGQDGVDAGSSQVGAATAASGPLSWFVPWQAAQQALGLPPLAPV